LRGKHQLVGRVIPTTIIEGESLATGSLFHVHILHLNLEQRGR
jgi:hypothetical protein